MLDISHVLHLDFLIFECFDLSYIFRSTYCLFIMLKLSQGNSSVGKRLIEEDVGFLLCPNIKKCEEYRTKKERSSFDRYKCQHKKYWSNYTTIYTPPSASVQTPRPPTAFVQPNMPSQPKFSLPAKSIRNESSRVASIFPKPRDI